MLTTIIVWYLATAGRHPAIQHAYAVTGHVAQGMTVDRAFVLGSPDMYREWGYTAMSRGRRANRLYVIAPDDLEHLDGLPAHVAELVWAAWELGGRPELDRLRLRAWAHMLGFRGHWSTKSRRYSTTFTVLRRARVAFAKRRRAKDGVPLDAWGRPEDDDQVIVVASWAYVGTGYDTEGERWLALSAAARAREQRRVAWEELRTTAA